MTPLDHARALCRDLDAVLDRERDALRRADVEEIEACALLKERLDARLRETVRDLRERQPEARFALAPALRALSEIAAANERLLSHLCDALRGAIAALAGEDEPPPTYNRAGVAAPRAVRPVLRVVGR